MGLLLRDPLTYLGLLPRQCQAGPNDFIVPQGLVGYWTMDAEDVDFTTAKVADRSAGGNSAAIAGIIASDLVDGQVGKALNYRLTTSALNLSSQFLGAGNITLSAWLKPNSGGRTTSGRIFDNGVILLYVSGTRFSCSVDGATDCFYAASTLATGQWQFICSTATSAGVVNNYYNGVLSGTANQAGGTRANGSTNLYIGNRSTGSRAIDGLLDEVRIYNRALDASEILTLYQAGLAGLNAWPAEGQMAEMYQIPVLGKWLRQYLRR